MSQHEMLEKLIQTHPGVSSVHTSRERGIEVVVVEGMFGDFDVRWRINVTKKDTICEIRDRHNNKVKARVKTSPMDNYDPEVGVGVALLKAVMKTGGCWGATKTLSSLIIDYKKTPGVTSP